MLALADDALVLSHRLGEWAGHAPVLEEELALANIALDLLGQARALYSLSSGTRTNWLSARPNGPSATASWWSSPTATSPAPSPASSSSPPTRSCCTEQLARLGHPLAAKAVKEAAYHRDHAEQWTLRLGDGTEEGHERMQRAVDALWRFTGELFQPLEGLGVDRRSRLDGAAAGLDGARHRTLAPATLTVPEGPRAGRGGRRGPAGPAHRALRPDARRDAASAPQPPGGLVVTGPARSPPGRNCGSWTRPARCRAGPRTAGASRSRSWACCAACGLRGTGRGGGRADPHLHRLPGHRGHGRRHRARTARARRARGHRPHGARARLETDDITAEGRRKLAEAGIAPPRGGAAPAGGGPVPLTLAVRCPHCGSTETDLLSRFSSTACKALRRCVACREPFDHFKEL